MTPTETLGYLAATCELEACYKQLPTDERRDLERRATFYRELQLIEMEKEREELCLKSE